jgi:hypothetical protein
MNGQMMMAGPEEESIQAMNERPQALTAANLEA